MTRTKGHVQNRAVRDDQTCASANPSFTWSHVQEILGRHDVLRRKSAATPWEGLVLGNADMGTIVFGPAHQTCLRLTKMDLWDGRMNLERYTPPLPLSKFKEWIFAQSKSLQKGEVVPLNRDDECWGDNPFLYPCMRMGADLLLRVCQTAGPPPTEQRLRLADGVHQMRFIMGQWAERWTIDCDSFVSWQHNVLCLRLRFPRHHRRNAVLSLWRDPYGGRSWENLSSGRSIKGIPDDKTSYRRDPRQGMLPPAEIAVAGNSATLRQVIPGDQHCPERGFSVAALCADPAMEFFMEPSGQAAMELFDRDELTFFVAMASEMEGPDSLARASALARQAAAEGYDALHARHATAWQEFWMQSAVELDDVFLERQYVRSSYTLAINARDGRPAPGLFGVAVMHDCPPWRGDRHNDYPEFSGLFWGAFASNHGAQALNYSRFVFNYLPTARRIASEMFECERGAAFQCCYVDGSDLYWFLPTWGRILWLTAIHAQNCWWQYQYFGDREFLRALAYPVMRDCADFYVELIRKNPPGDYTLWPTIACEIRGWTKDFELNRDCIEDLAHVKFLLRATLEAAEILNTDTDRRGLWRDLLSHLAPYPTLTLDGKEEFTDFAGQSQRPEYNHSVPMAPFWPAEDPDVIADARLRQIGINTLSAHPWDATRLTIAYMRLGMKDKVFERMLDQPLARLDEPNCLDMYVSGACSAMFPICEMLMTSWDGIVRVFPCWPLEKQAAFHQLRAKGAFLISASCNDGRVQAVSIRSEQGHPLRALGPWAKTVILCRSSGQIVAATVGGAGELCVDTIAGETYDLLPQGR